ncbi:hypothetical protein [Rhizobium hidalgonense]|uniref:Uncharacterized protein n=1 Tax=Rhizobium hidalgonense TaxID=1538159 RepID=A0ABX4JZ90_9HYPH|nr:hypothetical protein [Rhizobium hidalgonense]PDT24460.1 hypothetical protein CO674_07185 [Rhizobium hidalgonense]PON04851.1 hypothetical protein ATY29_25675 [Rhizobium hidalgonense]
MDAFAAAATFKDSVEAFGDAAVNELTRSVEREGSHRIARANIIRLYRARKTEIEKMVAAYSRRPWPTEHHQGVRDVAGNALAVLDLLYRDFQRNLAILHKRG